MLSKIKCYKFFLFFVFITLCLTMTSTWVTDAVLIPLAVNRVFTLLCYLPFILAIAWKLLTDIRSIKYRKPDVLTYLFYGFSFFYAVITAYRFFAALEIKENLYYTIVLLGSAAAYLLIRSGDITATEKELKKNLYAIAAYLVLYRLLYVFVGCYFFENQPINTNLLTGSLGILLPVLIVSLFQCRGDKKTVLLAMATLALALIVIIATGARAIFLLSILAVVVLVVCGIKNKTYLYRLVSVVGAAALVITVLAAVNFGSVRYALYRETGISVSSIFGGDSDGDTSALNPSNPNKDPLQDSAYEQILRSDKMRDDLMKWGIEEIKVNPWVGTGNVLFSYTLNERFTFMQSPHNFLIESVLCYGLIGTVILAAVFITIILNTGLFRKAGKGAFLPKIGIVLTAIYYFAFGFVQPTVFAPMICALFVLSLAAFSKNVDAMGCNKGVENTCL